MNVFKSRLFLLLIVPLLFVWISLGYYFSLGKLIKTDNAYIKAPIIFVQSEISGKINEVFVKNHQSISKNQKLFDIDTNDLLIELSKNKEILNSIVEEIEIRKSKLNEIDEEIKISEEDIKYREKEETRVKKLIKNMIINAQNELNFYKLEFNRQTELNKKGFGIKKKLEEAKLKFDKAKTDLLSIKFNKEVEETKFKKEIAKKNLNLLFKKRETILATLSGNKNISPKIHPLYMKQMAIINSINLKIKKSTLFADRDGFIANLNLEKGEFVKEGQTLFVIVDQQNIYVEANFKETQITNFKIGQKAKFIPDTFKNLKFEAIIDSLSPATGSEFAILPSQNSSGNWVKVVQRIPVRLRINNSNHTSKLKVGMTLSIVVNTEYKQEIPFIFKPAAKIFEIFNKF